MGFIDCHSHLSFLEASEVAKTIEKAKAKGLSHWVMGGYDFADWSKQKSLIGQFRSSIYTAFGLHPWKVVRLSDEEVFKELEKLNTLLPDADFIGETGIDLFISQGKERLDTQKKAFIHQLELAQNKPMVFHVVKAHSHVLEILQDYQPKAFVHGFSASYELAKQYLDKGILLSFGRGVLSKHYMKAREVVRKIPEDFLLIESDSPEDKKDRSSPVDSFFRVAEEVATLRKTSVEELLSQVKKNTERLGI